VEGVNAGGVKGGEVKVFGVGGQEVVEEGEHPATSVLGEVGMSHKYDLLKRKEMIGKERKKVEKKKEMRR